jgi:hypothetical protein
MRKYLNEEYKAIWDRHFAKAVRGGCDGRQAEQIAKENTLFDIMKASAAISHERMVANGTLTNQQTMWKRD